MQNKNKKSSVCGKWFAYPVADETVDLAALAHHMEEHNTGFSEAMCLGMMTGMVKCIKEMLLQGKNVKIDNLAIFSVGIKNKEGADSEEAFNAATNIAGVKLRARATGTLNSANLNSAASVRKANTKKASTSTGAEESLAQEAPIAAQPLRPLAAVEAATLAVAHLQEAVLPALGRRKAATSRSTSSKGISF